MKTLSPLCSLLILVQCFSPPNEQNEQPTDSTSRYTEFTIYENGLIYDEPTMSSLTKLVDSLSLRFKSCSPKTYYSLEQGYGAHFSLNNKYNAKALRAISKGISLEDFKKLFMQTRWTDSLWIVKSRDPYDGKPAIRYKSDGMNSMYKIIPDTIQFDRTKGWVYEVTDDGIEILYLYHLNSIPIPAEYGSMIQYVDCMIDTTATIFPPEERNWPDYDMRLYPKLKGFLEMSNSFEPEPTRPDTAANDSQSRKYDSAYKAWHERRLIALDEKMKDPENVKIFDEAIQELMDNQLGWWFVEFAERYLTASKLLEFKRSYRVYGFCSMDSGPRDHAMSICLLAAESRQWDIFLRAHMDILNDNFVRASDASYGRATRGTYLKEIEALDISSVELLVGMLLNAKNLSGSHYMATSWRVARAMAESKSKEKFEKLLLKMICDERLDLHNRIEMVSLLINYNDYAGDESIYRNNIVRIREVVEKLPNDTRQRFRERLND